MRLSDFLDDVGRPIAYYPQLALCLGSVNATILICQLFYWDGKQEDQEEGWIWKTQKQITEETGLSRRESDTARKVLREQKIITDKLRGVPPKIHFLINRKALDDLWDEWRKSPNQGGGKRQIKMAEGDKSSGGKRQKDSAGSAESKSTDAPDQSGGARHNIESETTPSETTSQTTRDHTHTGAPPEAEAPRARKGVGGSKFTLKQIKRWARWKASQRGSSIRDWEAVARARYRDGADDEEVEEFLAMEERERLEGSSKLPLFGDEGVLPPDWPELPPDDAREVRAASAWGDISQVLRGALVRASFETWIAILTPVRIVEGTLVLYAPNAVVRDWVSQNYADVLDGAVAEAGGAHGVREVVFMRPEEASRKVQEAGA